MEKLKHNEMELKMLKEELAEMWRLVLSQLQKCKQAYLTNDAELAREIISREKRINSFDLKIDSDCENYIALFAPVAVDLRLVLSLMKISGALERIGDFAEGIALQIVEDVCQLSVTNLKEDLKIETMFDIVISMLSDSFVALESENTKLSGRILQKDDEVDLLYREGKNILAEYIRNYPEYGRSALETCLILRRLERIGDHCSNAVEEIVFYLDAKILKHSKKQGAAESSQGEP
ncbi:MAG: phosphate signaling complex protein PhoU [Fibromonadaceae bacterium]|jgi:phosphate transport system protein|nr:phosphate signaling complex protein PhoU [Fibromonadaceae bacterium]